MKELTDRWRAGKRDDEHTELARLFESARKLHDFLARDVFDSTDQPVVPRRKQGNAR